MQHHPEPLAQQRRGQLPDVDAIEQDAAGLRFVEAAEQADDGCLAGAGGSDDRHMLPRIDAKAEVVQDRIIGAVGEAHRLEHHFAGTARRDTGRARAGRARQLPGHHRRAVLDVDRAGEQLVDPLHRGQAPLDLGEALRQLAQGIKQAQGEEDEGCQGAQPHRPRRDQPPARGQHQGDRRLAHPLDHRRDGAVVKNRRIHRLAVGPVGVAEVTAVLLLAAKHLHHLQPLQVFLQIGVELPQFLPHPVVDTPVAPLQPEHAEGDGNLQGDEHQPEPPLDHHHRDADHHQADQIPEQPHRTAAKHLRQGFHITGEAGDELAGGGGVVKAEGEGHHMAEERLPDASGELLTHHLHVVALDALQAEAQSHRRQQQGHQGAQGLGDRQAPQPGEHGFGAEHGDGLPHQQRLQGARQGEGNEQEQGQPQAAFVLAEIGQQPLQTPGIERGHQKDATAIPSGLALAAGPREGAAPRATAAMRATIA